MTPFILNYKRFERHAQNQKLSLPLTPKIEEIFETLETVDIDMTPSHSMIEPIVNSNFGDTFRNKNGPNQRQHTDKN